MESAPVGIGPCDLTTFVDPERRRGRGAGDINGHELAGPQQEPMRAGGRDQTWHCAVAVQADDVAAAVDAAVVE